jgi:hypothetical protein
MAKLLLTLSFSWMLTTAPSAYTQAEYCSLVVKVQDSKGVPVDVRVHITRSDGSVLDELTSEDGTARFCDLGVAPVTVSLGSAACKLLTLRNLYPEWRTERRLLVTYDPCHAEGGDAIFSQACHVLIRAVDQDGVGLAGARVTLNLPARIDPTDRFGRAFFKLLYNDEVTGKVEKVGYGSGRFTFRCSSEAWAVDKIVVVNKE